MKIAYIGFGEAARAFTDSLRGKPGVEIVAAFDIRQDAEMAAAAQGRGLRLESSVAAAMAGADWIVSAVTADQSLEAAKAAVPHLVQGQVLIDINSVSPGRKQETAALVEARGAGYLDMAVMAPVHPRGHATPVLVAGRPAAAMAPALEAAGFRFEVVADAPGQATAIKMVRSMFVKGLEALTVETLMAASATGCFDRVIGSLADTYPGLGFPDAARYMFERTLHHGIRRAAEMREVAATYDELGFVGGLADRVADVQERMGKVAAKDLPEGETGEAVAEVARQRLALGKRDAA